MTDIQVISEERITENMNTSEIMRSIPQADTSAKTNPSIDFSSSNCVYRAPIYKVQTLRIPKETFWVL